MVINGQKNGYQKRTLAQYLVVPSEYIRLISQALLKIHSLLYVKLQIDN